MNGEADIQRCIAHVDMDAFYASVEQRDRPELRGLPVLVGGSGPRGVVAAASYEARRFGIRSAMTASEARRRCPEAVFLRPRMPHYKKISTRIFDVFREFTPEVEGLSLDEAFLDLTASLRMFPSVEVLAARIKERIREETGLTGSVGAGPNKLVAKIASDLDKPDGLCVLFGDRISRTLDPLPARRIAGIGPRTSLRLERLGVRSVRELRLAPDSIMKQVFGRYADRMREKAMGIDHRPVCPHHPDQSISAEETFDQDIDRRSRLHSRLADLAQRVAVRVRRKGLQGATVFVKIRRSDFRTFSRQRRINHPTADPRTLARVARDLLDEWLEENPGAPLRLLGVGISGLAPASQMSLFEDRGEYLEKTIDSIRDRFGDGAVARGHAIDRD
jgi:DNA polymerase-4